jgi:hypothetical protein
MIVDLANILISKLLPLPFIDKYAGLVQVMEYGDNGKTKKYPAAVQSVLYECGSGRYEALTPDSNKKSVLYLEETDGLRFQKKQGYRSFFKGSFNLVCWLNIPKLGYEGTSYSGIAIQGILSLLPITPFNNGIYSQIKIQVTGQNSKSFNPFEKYSYDVKVNQFLMYPYDYFVLPIDIEFAVDTRCLTAAPLGTPIGCNTDLVVKYVTIINSETGEVVAKLTLGEVYPVDVFTQLVQSLNDPPS